ncbi:DEAD/DEAH box helicase [Bacteriovorax sp. Seq25_V]|uniref:DEAD/DEAH box helicase n=1 Tax=Bacteriovorax sp. Seq25_V TaxID=1201288 RepID=UPI00038A409F|nr:DEAD/DEAH box helicase [Bacteriovorax sp. Seq25_V]EQC43884.1 DEAD/DEAH box helicase [Bacteriovorax sp. Seq25_V]
MKKFEDLKLTQDLLKGLADHSFTTPTDIQYQAIPHIIENRDVLGLARTGTGKTVAFILPIVQKVKVAGVALIITPTRELATQIKNCFDLFGGPLGLKSVDLIGGVRKEIQIEKLKESPSLIVATPGRFIDLINNEEISTGDITTFIIDEADMLLDMGFLNDIHFIINKIPAKRQNLLFSATMPAAIELLANEILNNPVKVEVTPESSVVDSIEQRVFFVSEENKEFLLLSLLEQEKLNKVIIFCKAKYGVANVVERLRSSGVSVQDLHSNKSQVERERALKEFDNEEVRVLVATDIAARGLDISKVSHVINFNLPEDAANYVHRIGRTARAGKDGDAISLCSEKDLPLLRNIEALIKKKIPVERNHPFHAELVVPAKKKRSRRRR